MLGVSANADAVRSPFVTTTSSFFWLDERDRFAVPTIAAAVA
jgi:hypothetical protein